MLRRGNISPVAAGCEYRAVSENSICNPGEARVDAEVSLSIHVTPTNATALAHHASSTHHR